eukprot:6173541-Pleurochrysis_carterae.AAC.2
MQQELWLLFKVCKTPRQRILQDETIVRSGTVLKNGSCEARAHARLYAKTTCEAIGLFFLFFNSAKVYDDAYAHAARRPCA